MLDTDPESDVPDVPAPPARRRFSTRDLLITMGLMVVLLVLFEGHSIRHAGQELKPGWQRSLVLAVGHPAGWASDQLYLNDLKRKLTGWLRPDGGLGSSGPGGFDTASAGTGGAGAGAITPDAFDPAAIGAKPRPPAPLKTLLVTGDSLSQPLDATLARRLAQNGSGVKTIRDAHLGTGISKTDLVDWGRLSVAQVKRDRPQAIVMFIGANEGFPMTVAGKPVNCCSAAWAAEYARRARAMMNTFRQNGAARVYWLNLPGPRDPARQKIGRVVDAAIAVAAEPYRAQVRVLDMATLFTPGGKYRDAMSVNGGAPQIVREPDGIHLNQAGADLAATAVQQALRRDYGTQAGS